MIDADGQVAFLSAAMRQRLGRDNLGIGDPIPDAMAKALQPAPHAWRIENQDRGHQTCRLTIPLTGTDPGIHADLAAHAERAVHAEGVSITATAHFIRLASPPASAKTSDPASATTSSSKLVDTPAANGLILGCLGDFLPDADVPWEVWFASDGVRQAAQVAEQIKRVQADQKSRSRMLLAGDSLTSRRLRDRVNFAGQMRCHVALVGPRGSGATDLAVCIHHQSRANPDEPYVCLDAALMDAELLEVYASPAIAPLSHTQDLSSTLCLERLEEMPADGQQRLAQWLESWPDRLRLIGLIESSSQHTPDDDHAINANAVDTKLLPALADAMSLMRIELPTLASRTTDLAMIAQSLVETARLSRDAIQLIESYPWPGQWNEMLSAMQFAKQAVRGDRVMREHLPLAIRSFHAPSKGSVAVIQSENNIHIGPSPEPPQAFQIESLDKAVQIYESELIAKAMIAADGNKAEAARRLGISRARLLRKLADG
ncbi:DNA-binding transcriptional response regulator, NtrC family, contains REC, AAA-type ATPase, and a Fis-type DNA-binding domains [Neorhodopirellula lusitana]|uniref:DNA-binding transcriptional response regulator, NtrC family, contains REC, AAA-type ATPase, and a Fis-type DNA-binding domains n=1 Tax=Neorhodopirellula lusitana TaxID=445327 RepID=A0ABY1PMS0_9BACT|nr:helix-turn-helix domain-containing protein [Neorhodopirellula lusitana]SMP37911.1 DNA-binding transcriptional response regulator, NtrC family, contains REC, AAA-type ATPase, and a Fis-type DNA-binding domains [Neorhodopirellula lusitana]